MKASIIKNPQTVGSYMRDVHMQINTRTVYIIYGTDTKAPAACRRNVLAFLLILASTKYVCST